MEMRVTEFEMKGEKYALAMMNDISERIKAEEALKESLENYSFLVEQANDGIVVLQDGLVKFVNTALTKLTGYTVDELVESNFLEYVEVNEHEKVKSNYIKRMKGERVPPYESKIIRKNGEILEVEFSGGLTFYNGAAADLAIVRDITERKKAEEERNRIFNLSNELISIIGFDGYFKQLNPAWLKSSGYSKTELTSKTFIDLVHPDDVNKTLIAMKTLISGKEVRNFQNRYLHKSGAYIDLSWNVFSLVERELIYCIAHDITEQKQKEKQILQYQGRLKDQALELTLTEEKQRKQIATDLHDHVGQILASNRMQIAAMTNKMSKAELLGEMQKVSKGLLNALKSTRSLIFDLSPPQLNEIGLYAATADWMEEEIEEKYGIQTNISREGDIAVNDDNLRILLFRCIRELLINIVKHAKASKVDVFFNIQYSNLSITVSDNGVGFNYQPEMIRMTNAGFGLFSIIERVEDMGGSVVVKTAPKHGTNITILVPLNQ
jgi:PAS domain S-box-containing protein